AGCQPHAGCGYRFLPRQSRRLQDPALHRAQDDGFRAHAVDARPQAEPAQGEERSAAGRLRSRNRQDRDLPPHAYGRAKLSATQRSMIKVGDIIEEWDFQVEAGKVREFARAVHDVHSEDTKIAPPTFPVVAAADFVERLVAATLSLDRSRTVHGEQAY